MRFPVMGQTISGQAVTLEATGNARRDDATTAVNRQKYTNLQVKPAGDSRPAVDGLDSGHGKGPDRTIHRAVPDGGQHLPDR